MRKLIFILLVCLVLCGCLTYQKYSFKFDYGTGRAEKIYHDIQSQKRGDEKDYSVGGDWELLKSRVSEEFGKKADPDVIKPLKAELFQEGNVLSGREMYEVQLPKAFPSKKAILERLHGDEEEGLEFQIINNEIFLFLGSREVESSNGKIIKTANNNMIVWPEGQLVFEFTIDRKSSGGQTLLPFYLKEKETKGKKE